MLACAGLLRAVAGVSVPTDGPAALLAHGDGSGIKLALSCEEGCSGKQFCLAAPCCAELTWTLTAELKDRATRGARTP